MRCVSYVAARNYPIALLATKLKQEGYKVNLYRNKVLYIFSKSLSVEAYCFDHGCLVCWGMLRRREQELLAFINSFATQLFFNLNIKVYGPGSFSSHSSAFFAIMQFSLIQSNEGAITENGFTALSLSFLIFFTEFESSALQPMP